MAVLYRFFAVLLLVACPLTLAAGGCGANCPSWCGGGRSSETDAAPGNRLGGVAVVDLDEVARRLGTDAALLKQINDGQASLNQQLQTLQTSLQEKYRQKTREIEMLPIGNGVTPESQKQQLAGLERELNLQLNQAKRSAQNNLSVYRQRLIQRFRAEVIPAAREAAAERGLGVVVTKNDSVLLTFDDAHDITAAVVARLRAKHMTSSKATAASPPANAPASTPARRY